MNTLVMETKNRWVTAGLGALVVVGSLALLVRVPPLPLAHPAGVSPPAPPVVALARTGASQQTLADETRMRDLTPLFLPTEWNARAKQPPLREPGEGVLDVQPLKLEFAEGEIRVARDLPAVATLNGQPLASARPVDLLSEGAGTPALGFGRSEVAVIPLPPRGGFVEVVESATGRSVLAEALPPQARPSTARPWGPLEFMAAVDAAGLVAPLALTAGSQVDEVDAHYRNYLVRSYRIGERLPPGFYRIIVGP